MAATLGEPDLWNSAYRPILYEHRFAGYPFTAVGASGSNSQFTVSPGDTANFSVGQRVYIASGIYAGNHSVQAIGGNYIELNVTYISGTSGDLVPLFNVSGTLQVGYDENNLILDPHPGHDIYPLNETYAELTAIPGLDGRAFFDVSGFIQSVFKDVVAPTIGADFSMSVPFKLDVSGFTTVWRYAINGTFPHSDLNDLDAIYRVLNARDPIHFENGTCIYSMIWQDTSINGEHIFNIVGTHGTGEVGTLSFNELKQKFENS